MGRLLVIERCDGGAPPRHHFREASIRVGRALDADLVIDERHVSRQDLDPRWDGARQVAHGPDDKRSMLNGSLLTGAEPEIRMGRRILTVFYERHLTAYLREQRLRPEDP